MNRARRLKLTVGNRARKVRAFWPVQRGERPNLRHGHLEPGLAGAFGALASIGDDFLPEGRQQGEPQEREAF